MGGGAQPSAINTYFKLHCTDFPPRLFLFLARCYCSPLFYTVCTVSKYHFCQARGFPARQPFSTDQMLLGKSLRTLDPPKKREIAWVLCKNHTTDIWPAEVQIFLSCPITFGVYIVFNNPRTLVWAWCHPSTLKCTKMSFSGSVSLSGPTKYRSRQQCWHCPTLAW